MNKIAPKKTNNKKNICKQKYLAGGKNGFGLNSFGGPKPLIVRFQFRIF